MPNTIVLMRNKEIFLTTHAIIIILGQLTRSMPSVSSRQHLSPWCFASQSTHASRRRRFRSLETSRCLAIRSSIANFCASITTSSAGRLWRWATHHPHYSCVFSALTGHHDNFYSTDYIMCIQTTLVLRSLTSTSLIGLSTS